MPQYPPHEIEEIKKCFAMYVKFPKNRWKEIERAEKMMLREIEFLMN